MTINSIMESNYIRMFKLPNLAGGVYFSVTTSCKLGTAGQAIGQQGEEILKLATAEKRTIYRTDLKDGAICYVICKK